MSFVVRRCLETFKSCTNILFINVSTSPMTGGSAVRAAFSLVGLSRSSGFGWSVNSLRCRSCFVYHYFRFQWSSRAPDFIRRVSNSCFYTLACVAKNALKENLLYLRKRGCRAAMFTARRPALSFSSGRMVGD